MKRTIAACLAALVALSLIGCSTMTMVGKDGMSVTETALMTKSTLTSGSAKLGADGASITVKGLESDPTQATAIFGQLLMELLKAYAAIPAATAAAQPRSTVIAAPPPGQTITITTSAETPTR